MKRYKKTWGVYAVITSSLISIFLIFISNSCSSYFICWSDILFLILNLIGTLLFLLIYSIGLIQISPNISYGSSTIMFAKIIMILVSLPFYYIIGLGLKRLFRK